MWQAYKRTSALRAGISKLMIPEADQQRGLGEDAGLQRVVCWQC